MASEAGSGEGEVGEDHPTTDRAGDGNGHSVAEEIRHRLEGLEQEVTDALHRVARLEWVVVPRPERLHKFIYDQRGLLLCTAAAIVTYLLLYSQPEVIRRTMAVFIFAALCWLLEVFPIAITGLTIPVLLTLLGVFDVDAAFSPFAHPVIFLLIGGLVLGQAMRRHGLDQRLAHSMLAWSKGRIDRLVLLIMLGTAMLSMWMSNTVAIAVLLPVVLSIVGALPEDLVNLRRKILLGMTISTTLGGMMMLTGSTPNLIAAAALEGERPFGFSQWAYYGFPVGMAILLATFLILKRRYPSPDVTLDMRAVDRQRREAGPMTTKQKGVLYVFGLTIFLWFFGNQLEAWLGLPQSISSASIVSIIAVLILGGINLLDMEDVHNIQWEIIFLLGGGLLLGEAIAQSGAAALIASSIASTQSVLPDIVIVLMFIVITLVFTNFISNTATAAILVPIAIQTALDMGIDPTIPVMGIGLAASVAFITPVGTPSTAMIYATGQLPKGFLVRNGVLVAVVAMVIILAAVWFMPIP
jgi:sodium-dependent dicarboxylate transporter 2/3/5